MDKPASDDTQEKIDPASEKKKSAKKKNPPKPQRLRSDRKVEGLLGQMGGLTVEQINSQPNSIGVIYDERMSQPHSLWDPNFPENPERIRTILEKCQLHGLIDRCVRIPARPATEAEILLQHTEAMYELVHSTVTMDNQGLRDLSKKYDGIYFHPQTYEASMLAAGSAIELTDQIVNRKIRHGLAITRPPGHHSQPSEPNGYCIFNNVAIAARHATDNLGFERVLIIDWDVHHGQGTQEMFYDDPRVLYFSVHRYEHGNFWPNLRESDYDSIGAKGGRGFNINVPINELGVTNSDYLAIFQQVILPVAYEFNPELVLLSSGYDAAIGDPEGMSRVTPACYAHLTHMVKSLAGGRLGLILEGGYCLKSQAEGVAYTLAELLGEPCPDLGQLDPILAGTTESILQVIRVLRPYWRCFSYHPEAKDATELPGYFTDIEMPKQGVKFVTEDTKPQSNPLVDDYEKFTSEELEEVDKIVEGVLSKSKLLKHTNRTCLVYDEKMRKHRCKGGNEHYMTHPERPDRISAIYDKHRDCGLLERCKLLQSRLATDEELVEVHGSAYVEQVRGFQYKSKKQLDALEGTYSSIYLSHDVYECASLAVGCTLNVVDEVMTGRSTNGVAIVRPPGHHAEPHSAMGFCYFNSVAVAARYAQRCHGIRRVLILDWDVHHGNGTQQMYECDDSVLYISLHRYDDGMFFPGGPGGNYDVVGERDGRGFNVNIPWNHRSMGDAEYLAAFQQVVMPISYEFAPELVLVSAGFDAAKGDPLGGCKVSPQCFAQMTHMLSGLANGKVILVLEGGYNLNSISESMAACTSVLLGDVCPYIIPKQPCDSAIQSICKVLDTHQVFWKSLRFRVRMPTKQDTKNWLKETSPSRLTDEDDSSPRSRTPSPDSEACSPQSQGPGSLSDQGPSNAPDQEPRSPQDQGSSSLPDQGLNSLQDQQPSSPQDREPCSSADRPSDQGPGSSPEVRQEADQSDVVCSLSGGDVDDLTARTKKLSVEPDTVAMTTQDVAAACTVKDDGIPAGGPADDLIGACGGSDPQPAIGAPQELFSVVPLPWCPHLAAVTPVPPGGLDTGGPCVECGNMGENWVCLCCYEVHCSRYVQEHMLFHGLATDHRMVLSYADLSVWCYGCDSYVHNEVLTPAKRSAHLHKFGVDISA